MTIVPAEVHPPSAAERGSAPAGGSLPLVSVNRVRFSRPPSTPDGALRDLDAEVELSGAGDPEPRVVGRVRGRLGWLAWLPEHLDSAPDPDSAHVIGTAIRVGNYLSAELGAPIESVLIVEDLWLDPPWRGAGVAATVAEQLIDLLLLTPEFTLVLGFVESPAGPPTGPAPTGTHAGAEEYRAAGFERWLGGNAWFLRPVPGE